MTISDFAKLFPGAKWSSDSQFTGHCPVDGHAHGDATRSVSAGIGNGGRILVKCFAGHTAEQICGALGIRVADLFPKAQAHPLTLAELANAKKLSVDWLREHGVEDFPDGSGVAIGYHDENKRQHPRLRKRTALRAKDGSSWLGPKGVSPIPYGCWLLPAARAKRFLVVVEGESDCWALWYHDYPALGMPGATNVNSVTPDHLRGFERLFVTCERDPAGRAFPGRVARHVRKLGFKGEVLAITMPDDLKDPADLHVSGTFDDAFPAILAAATSIDEAGKPDDDESKVAEFARLSPFEFDRQSRALAKELGIREKTLREVVLKTRKRFEHSNGSGPNPTGSETSDCSNDCSNGVRTLEQLEQSARPIIEAPDVLELVKSAIGALGYAGDRNPVVLLYVAISSRCSDKPINAHVMAQSATGKSYAIDTAARLCPDEELLKLSAMSPKALIHGSDDLQHKCVILGECDSLSGLEGNAATLIRSIVEDARTDFDVVERNPETGESVTRRISKEGPTGLITSGVRELEPQLAPRVLNIQLLDTADQTREILHAEAALASGDFCEPDPVIIEQFVDFQRWLSLKPKTVAVVPYARILAEFMPVAEVRMRRDFKQLLVVIRTVAWLNQAHRSRNGAGAIVANLEDYHWARELLLSVFQSIAAGGLTDAIRATCLAVPEGEEVSEVDLVKSLGLAKSTVHYRVGRTLKSGWLENREHRKGYAYRLVRGLPLPEDQSPLPTVEELQKAFEHSPYSNGHSNGPQTTGGVGQTEQPFEGSNDSAERDYF